MSSSTRNSEEWFDEEATDPEDQEFSKLQQLVWKEGYKEGLQLSKDKTLQQGFEEGFASCVEVCFPLGQLKGELRAYIHHHASSSTEAQRIASAKALLQEVESFEERSLKISVSEVTKEDLPTFHRDHETRRTDLQQAVVKLVSKGASILQANPD